MNLVRSFLNRKAIDLAVAEIVDKHFGETTKRKLIKSTEKQSQKKLEKVIVQLKGDLKDYIRKNKLGIYGKARVLKQAQSSLINFGFEESYARQIVEKLIFG